MMTNTENGEALRALENEISVAAHEYTKGLPHDRQAPESAAHGIEQHANGVIGHATSVVVSRLRALRDKLDELEAMVVADSARVQMEVQGHIRMSASAMVAADAIERSLTDMQENRSRVIEANTR